MAPFWRVAFNEDDEESRAEAMEIFWKMDQLTDKFRELGVDPSVQMIADGLNAQGVDVYGCIDSDNANVIVPRKAGK